MKRFLTPMLFFITIFLLLLSSCQTTEPTVEYVTVDYDWENILEPVLKQRPDTVKLIDAPETLSDIMQNSVSFQYAYNSWRDYAETLETLYLNISGNLLPCDF